MKQQPLSAAGKAVQGASVGARVAAWIGRVCPGFSVRGILTECSSLWETTVDDANGFTGRRVIRSHVR